MALNKKNLESQPSYQALAGLGTKINKPPQVLGTIASGVDEAVGRVASVNIAYDPNLVDSKYESNPVFSVFGALDLTFIVKIVLSLFAILFTYDAIVGEKERGTLKLTLSNRVPARPADPGQGHRRLHQPAHPADHPAHPEPAHPARLSQHLHDRARTGSGCS